MATNETIIDSNVREKDEMYNVGRAGMKEAAIELKECQTKLYKDLSDLSKEIQQIVMPDSIDYIKYSQVNQGEKEMTRTSLWNVLLEMVVNVFSLLEYDRKDIIFEDPKVQMILDNFLNSVLSHLDKATEGITEEIQDNGESVINTGLIITIGAGSLIIICSIIVLLFLCKIRANRSQVLKLFNHLHPKHIDIITRTIRKLHRDLQKDLVVDIYIYIYIGRW